MEKVAAEQLDYVGAHILRGDRRGALRLRRMPYLVTKAGAHLVHKHDFAQWGLAVLYFLPAPPSGKRGSPDRHEAVKAKLLAPRGKNDTLGALNRLAAEV